MFAAFADWRRILLPMKLDSSIVNLPLSKYMAPAFLVALLFVKFDLLMLRLVQEEYIAPPSKPA